MKEHSSTYLGEHIDCERLLAELPALMIYSIAMSGGDIAPHEALAVIDDDVTVEGLFEETRKLAKLYKKVKRLTSSYITALEIIGSRVCSRYLEPLLGTYTTFSVISGKSREAIYMLANKVKEVFRENLERKLKQASAATELIVAMLAGIVMAVVLTSVIASAASAAYAAFIVAIAVSLPLAVMARIKLLDTYIDHKHTAFPGLMGELAILISVLFSACIHSSMLPFTLTLAALSLAAKLVALYRLFASIGEVGRLAITSRVLAETINVGGSSYNYITVRIKSVAGSQAAGIIYALKTGRTLVSKGSVGLKLSQLLARITTLSIRSGGQAASSLKLTSALFDLLESSLKRAATAAIANMALIAALAAFMQLSLSLIYVHFSAQHYSYSELSFFRPIGKEQVLLALFLTAAGSIVASYAITYAMLARPWYNIAPPVIVAATVIAKSILGC